jgi:hypothetical protein
MGLFLTEAVALAKSRSTLDNSEEMSGAGIGTLIVSCTTVA